MTGIRSMFREYSGQDLDWFQLAFAFEALEARRRMERQTPEWRHAHRLAQKRYDLRKHGPRRARRGRPSLGLSAEEMRERRRKQNRRYYEERKLHVKREESA